MSPLWTFPPRPVGNIKMIFSLFADPRAPCDDANNDILLDDDDDDDDADEDKDYEISDDADMIFVISFTRPAF